MTGDERENSQGPHLDFDKIIKEDNKHILNIVVNLRKI